MPTDAEAKRAWEGAKVRGELDAYLLPIRQRYQALRIKLEGIIVKRVLSPAKWGELQHLQGQIKGLADIIWALDQLSKPEREHEASKRRKVEE